MTRTILPSAREGLKTVSGTRTIKAPLEKIAGVLTDCATKTEWVSGLVEEREIERGAEFALPEIPAAFVVYQHYTLMPILSDRDYVISGAWHVSDAEDGKTPQKAQLDLQSVEHDQAPAALKRVRAALNTLVYTLEALPNEEGTLVKVECNVDPLGVFPIFMVNLYASTWSDKTLAALDAQVMKTS